MLEFIGHTLRFLIIIVLGVIYLPLNLLFLKIQDYYNSIKKDDPVLYWTIRIGIFPLWGVVAILSAPYELLVESAH
jgi:hypothetical protein